MIKTVFNDIVTPELSKGAILNKEFQGFEQDYLVLHCLLRKYRPKSLLEIGTNFGTGTNIICNALPSADVYSLELPLGEGDAPLNQGGRDMTGRNCKFRFTQLRGNSLYFDYDAYPCEAYYVDGSHFYENVLAETEGILRQMPDLVIYHDTDIPEVLKAIKDAMNTDYELYRVTDTRISYLLRK